MEGSEVPVRNQEGEMGAVSATADSGDYDAVGAPFVGIDHFPVNRAEASKSGRRCNAATDS
eukprot:8196766-Pyramimonas_sp.AAC.1